eukprot:gnl/MRDRNA2_/MRDRNA2_116477_c0_seq1.p1 gnl/MRDRNA2_/MRDRNA2_116477_c0~~gnl/MRDRNA2_/MRDRNA2_116477_c0_seq1.p1  ORF type:complete len:278 (+),score=57.69 gnl/MRDRNA2_/MRDRNA2_116477_c0_seq1:37-834(+)
MTKERRLEHSGSLGPTPRSMFEKQDWSMPLDFSSSTSKLKEFPSLSKDPKEPFDLRAITVPMKKMDAASLSERNVVPRPPSSSSSKNSSRPSSRPCLRSKQTQSQVAESNAAPCGQGTDTFEVRKETVKGAVPSMASDARKDAGIDAVDSCPPRKTQKELVIGDQTSAVIRQVLPVVQRALASSNPAVFDTTLKMVLRLAKVFGQESIVAHQDALLDGVEKRLRETPTSAQRAPRVLQMLGDVGGAKTIEEIKRRFPQFKDELSG